MAVDAGKVGLRIASLRKDRRLTQAELGERLRVSFQAVSKWERGESLPDVSSLVDLAEALNTSVDDLLNGGEAALPYRGRMAVGDMREGILCLHRMGVLLGRHNPIYRGAVEGLGARMNSDVEAMLEDEDLRECLIAEAVIQNMKAGYRFDRADIRKGFARERWADVVLEHGRRYMGEEG